ncbi:hypothetical protein [Rhizobium sp. Rhizsp42]
MTSSRMLAVVGITDITVADGLVALATSLIMTSMPAIPTFFRTAGIGEGIARTKSCRYIADLSHQFLQGGSDG